MGLERAGQWKNGSNHRKLSGAVNNAMRTENERVRRRVPVSTKLVRDVELRDPAAGIDRTRSTELEQEPFSHGRKYANKIRSEQLSRQIQALVIALQ